MKERMWFRSISKIVVMSLTMGSLLLCIEGCTYVRDVKQDDPFRLLYNAERKEVRGEEAKTPEVYLTLSAFQMPLSLFCRILSDKYDIGMVFSHELSERQITAEFKKTDLQSVLNVVSRQIGVDIVRVGNTYFIGALRPEDRGVLVRRIMGYDQQSLNSIVTPMLSQTGKAQVMSNGVLVATDHESVLRRLVEMCDYLDTVYPGSWILQLYFVSLRKDAMLEAGFDTKSSGSISYDIANSKIDLNDIKLEGLFSFGSDSNFTDVFAAPMMVIRDGSTGVWRDGERVPIPKKTVSDAGTVSTTGFEYVDTGFILNATIRESRRGGIVKLDITQSQIKNYVEYSPVTSETQFTLECDLVPGKIYLLGELSTFKRIEQQQNIALFSADAGKTSMQIWAKLYRVSTPVSEAYPRADRFSAAPAGAPENEPLWISMKNEQ